ncbi:MAG TPA: iron ABC transporter permease [Enterobacteriaceae bacterium]|nr:iron ABC transporter permease [Enterobacteriaceae bacterium]
MSKPVIFRLGAFSRQWAPRLPLTLFTALLVTLLLALFSLSCGEVWIPPWRVAMLLVSQSDTPEGFIVNQLRLPRMVLALLVGGGLSLAGLLLQNMVRNPLASPDLMGISAGASAAAVLWLALFGSTFLPFAAMAGGAMAVLLVFILAWRQGLTPLRLVLTGVGVSALAGALTTLVLVFSPLTTTLSAWVWLSGSVYGAGWEKVRLLAGVYVLALPLLVWCARHVVTLQLTDGSATSLGARVQVNRILLLLICAMLAGAAIATGGAMAFVGLVAPHIARLQVRNGFVGQAWVATLTGGTIVMLADVAARVLFQPVDLPAGIFVAAFGAPFFLWLLLRQRA